MTATVTLQPVSGSAISISFPGGHDRGSIDGCVRHFQRLGELGVRYYWDLDGAESVWIANAHKGVGVVDFKAITIKGDAGTRVVGGLGVECIPTRRGFVVRLSEPKPKPIPDPVVNFGPIDLPHPKVDRAMYEARAAANLSTLRSAITAGSQWQPSFPGLDNEGGLMLTGMGRWRVLGPTDNGAPAGSDVRFMPGFDQSESGALLEQLRMDCAIERTLHAWNDQTGDSLTVEDYGDPGPQYVGSRDPHNSDGELPGFRLPGVGPSQCPYRDAIENVRAYDFAHDSRARNPAIVAWEYRRDPIAADFLVGMAEEARLAFSDKGIRDPNYFHHTLRNVTEAAASKPGQGGGCGRLHGNQGLDVAMANKVRPRPEYRTWSRMFQRWAEKTQMPNGLYQRNYEPPLWGPFASTQSMEAGIWGMSMLSQAHQFSGNALTIQNIEKMAAAMYFNRRVPLQSDPWHPKENASWGPWHFLFVAPQFGEPFPQITGGVSNQEGTKGGGDPAHCEALCAALFFLTGLPKYRAKLLEVGWPAPTLEAKRVLIEGNQDLSWTSTALAAIQKG